MVFLCSVHWFKISTPLQTSGFHTEIFNCFGGGGNSHPPLNYHTKVQFSDMLEDVQFEEVLEIFKRKKLIL